MFQKMSRKKCPCLNEITRLIMTMKMNTMTMNKMKMKMKNRSHIYDIYKPSVVNIKMYQYEDAYIYQATPKQHLKHNS